MSIGSAEKPKPFSLTDGPIVSLEQILYARELRAKRQQQLLSLYKTPLLSLTLVIPGEIKKSSGSLFLFKEALATAIKYFKEHKLSLLHQQTYSSDTGYEALMTINMPAVSLKTHAIHLENTHPLGRFWDFDVIDQQGILSRKDQQSPARTCLLCDNYAHACARSRKHDIKELLTCIETLINQFNDEHVNRPTV